MVTQTPDEVRVTPESKPSRRQAWTAAHRPFLVALGLAVVVRLVVQVAFMPAFVHSDGPTYLSVFDHLEPDPERPVGYVLLLLMPVLSIADNVLLVAIAQHLLGLATAVMLYVLLRRWGAGRITGMLGTLPILFDYLQLNLEHTVLSDVLFEFLLVAGISVLCWNRRVTPRVALLAGLLLGVSTTVRLVAEPLVVVLIAYCLLVGVSWRTRIVTAAVATLGFALPIGAYATWYHQEHGVYAMSQFTGASLYLRTTTFADCAQLSIPDYQRVLCPGEPLGDRRDPTYYVFHDPRTIGRLFPPPGVTQDEAMREFALSAMRAQPLDYLQVGLRDFMLNFDLTRVDRYEYDTAHKWGFEEYVDLEPTGWTGPAYAAHGGKQLEARQPLADLVVLYQKVGYVPGPLLFGCLLLGLAGALGFGRARDPGLRSVTALLTVSGVGLLFVPDLTAEFVWRYQLPGLVLLPAAAVLGYTALRGERTPQCTEATASTD
jgi:hypothetical protein